MKKNILKTGDDLFATLKQKILAGELKPGERLPVEREFARSLNVARNTLRNVLDHLEEECLIRREPGIGTFVTDFSEDKERRLYYFLPCADYMEKCDHLSCRAHMQSISGLLKKATAFDARLILLPVSRTNSSTEIDFDEMNIVPAGSKVFLPGATWYKELFPWLIRKKCRVATFTHIMTPGIPDTWLVFHCDHNRAISEIADFFIRNHVRHPLFVLSSQALFHEETACEACRSRGMSFSPKRSILRGIEDSHELRREIARRAGTFDGVLFDMEKYRPLLNTSLNLDLGLPEKLPILARENFAWNLNFFHKFSYLEFPLRDNAETSVEWLFSNEPGRIVSSSASIMEP